MCFGLEFLPAYELMKRKLNLRLTIIFCMLHCSLYIQSLIFFLLNFNGSISFFKFFLTYLTLLLQPKKDISTVEDPFDAPTYNIPEKPVTFTEGASYSLIILAGLGVAGAAAYAVFKELIFEPKE